LDTSCSNHVGVRVKFFVRNPQEFPTPSEGDAVAISRIKKTSFRGEIVLLKSHETRLVVFNVAQLPDEVIEDTGQNYVPLPSIRRYPKTDKRKINQSEEICAVTLWRWAVQSDLPVAHKIRDRSESKAPNHPVQVMTVTPRNERRAILSQVQHQNFYDLVGEVVKTYMSDIGQGRVTLYLTDYTMNHLFYSYTGEPDDVICEHPYNESISRQWKGPEGKYTLQITLWSPHAEFAHDNVNVGSFVELKNVKIVYKDQAKVLEGTLHEDQSRPNQVNVRVLEETHLLCKEIISRKETFNASRTNTELGKSKKKRQKRKRQQREKEFREKLLVKDIETPQGDPFLNAHRLKQNVYIAAAFSNKTPQPLHSIMHSPLLHGKTSDGDHITYPFMLLKFRANVRVVDFYPPKLEDFSHSLDDPEFNDCSAPEDSTMDEYEYSTSPPRWEWSFFLLVEDGNFQNEQQRVRMNLLVAGPDAEYLLKLTASE
jgi:protection of telomeres protein 1